MTTVVFYFVIAALIMVITHIVMNKRYTVIELFSQMGATLLAIILVVFIGSFMSVWDSKVIHGVVTNKEFITKNCRSTWQEYKDSWCENHYTRTSSRLVTKVDDKGNRRLETEYYDEYKPVYRWERKWYVRSTIEDYRIDSVDRQGANMPQRYGIVNIGDPVSGYKTYSDYMGAASTTLFKFEDDAYPDDKIVKNDLYDYYTIDQFYSDGIDIEKKKLNDKLARVNSKLTNGANIVVYATDKPNDIATSLQVKWQGFEINDVVMVLGVDKDTGKYQYVKVFSWSESSMVDVRLTDFMIGKNFSGIYDDLDGIGNIVQNEFEEPSPDKFKYLLIQIGFPLIGHIILLFIILIVTPTVTYFLAKD